ncbi:stearoyl-CoA desaturase, putative [Hepatocystis sp. ex Piliocolobus tephrosceles]|nr:stearoyl-CoA desaturase, putative [Hepatocystis sp. ex Piliocolobus tephrosceles]
MLLIDPFFKNIYAISAELKAIIQSGLTERYFGIEHVVLIYVTYFVFLVSCYLSRKSFSDKFINSIKVIKDVSILLLSFISLKYLGKDNTLSINLLHLYNIIQVCVFLEKLKKTIDFKSKCSKKDNKIVIKYELNNENESMVTRELQLIGETAIHLQKIAKNITKHKEVMEDSDKILKEKELIDSIEQKEKEEEEYMKKLNKAKKNKNNQNVKAKVNNTAWIFFLLSQTFYVFFYYFMCNIINNSLVIRLYLTLQLFTNLICVSTYLYKDNSNFKLFKQLVEALNIAYLFGISLFLTKIIYSSYNNSEIMNKFLIIFGLIKVYFHSYGKSLLIQCITLYLLNGFGITFGAHRMWSHRAFKANIFVEAFFLLLNSIANQGSVITWSRNHRLHHKYSDTKYDPHNITYGFFYSHVGWLLYQKTKYVREKEKEIYVDDLFKKKMLVIQHKLDPYFNLFCCFILPSIYTYFMYNSFWDGFFILGALRWIITLHATWSINSVSHSIGHRPYNSDIRPADNIFTSAIALGEGAHNYHHVFPYCYAMNENFYIFSINPTKHVINCLYYLGLVWDLKSAQHICKAVRLREKQKIEKRNKMLSDNIKKEIMKKEDTGYITELMNSLKSFCNDYLNISTFRYILYLFRDITIMLTILLIHICYCYYKYEKKQGLNINFDNIMIKPYTNNMYLSIFSFIFFHIILYALPMGTMFTSLYSIVYDCRKGLLYKNNLLNNIIGSVISSFILLPYSSEKAPKSLLTALDEDILKILKGPIYVDIYSVIFLLFVGIYGLIIHIMGFFYFSLFFLAPYIVFNTWLYVYKYLLRKLPCLNININSNNIDISVLNYFAVQSLLEWKKNNSIYQSKTRIYNIIFSFINWVHHHLCYTHVVEYINSKIPSYRTKEIYKHFDKTLDQYSFMLNENFLETLKQFL